MWTYIINVILFFALWSIMGLDIYCYLIFYGLTLIHSTDPLSQVVQIMCVMCDIYIYIGFFLAGEGTHSRENTLGLNLGEEREELIEPKFSYHRWTELLLEHRWRTKWLSMMLGI